MSTPYWSDESITLWHGDAFDVLSVLPDCSVDCCVTSPPYFGLRDYGAAGQLGLELLPAEYVARLVSIMAEMRRVLTDAGTCWLNLGDSYNTSGTRQGNRGGAVTESAAAKWYGRNRTGLPEKNLLGIPWRVAFALQDAGWILRNAIIWHKSNAMPESVTDRLSNRYESVFLFSKSRRYWFDLDPIREPITSAEGSNDKSGQKVSTAAIANGWAPHRGSSGIGHTNGRNPGDIWTIPTSPFPGAHFACMPPALVERCILAGCKPGGTVLDPFSGSGTTGMAATKHGRRYVGIELNDEYLDLSLRTRLAQTTFS